MGDWFRLFGSADAIGPKPEISEGRAAKRTFEHEREGSQVLIAEIDRNRRDGSTCGEPGQGAKEAGLLSPRYETHASFAPE
jgi:hypothetical protein